MLIMTSFCLKSMRNVKIECESLCDALRLLLLFSKYTLKSNLKIELQIFLKQINRIMSPRK